MQALHDYLGSSVYRLHGGIESAQGHGSARITLVEPPINTPAEASRSKSGKAADQGKTPPIANAQSSRFQEDLEMCRLPNSTRHLLICIERGRYKVEFCPGVMTDIIDDQQLFHSLRSSYQKRRWGVGSWLSLRTINSIHFMKVRTCFSQ